MQIESQSNTPNLAPRFQHSQIVARAIEMSSLEISELVGSRHDNVRKTIERLVDRGVIQQPALQEVKNHLGQGVATYMVCKRDSFVVVAQLSPEFTAALVDRWQELESKPVFDYAAALNDPRTLLALLTDNVKKVVALEANNSELSHENLMLEQKVVADAPKVDFFNAVITSTSIHSVREVAQSIGTGQNRLFAFMRQQRWVDRHNTPYQGRVESGLLVAEPHSYKCPETGERKTKFTCKVTGKGFTKLQSLWASRETDLLGGDV